MLHNLHTLAHYNNWVPFNWLKLYFINDSDHILQSKATRKQNANTCEARLKNGGGKSQNSTSQSCERMNLVNLFALVMTQPKGFAQ